MRTRTLEETINLYIELMETDPLNAYVAPREYLNGLLLLTTRTEIETNLHAFEISTNHQAHPQTLALFAALIDEICDALSLTSPVWTNHPSCHSPTPHPKKRDVGQHQHRNLYVYDLLSEFDRERMLRKPLN
jgi:hypothetical protein